MKLAWVSWLPNICKMGAVNAAVGVCRVYRYVTLAKVRKCNDAIPIAITNAAINRNSICKT
jgi:hypothetical protein